MIKTRTREADEVDITPMIDIVFQLIIFFMVVMAIAMVYGVAIKFPQQGKGKQAQKKKEKNVVVYIESDKIEKGHFLIKDGLLKLNGEEIVLTKDKFDLEKVSGMSQEQFSEEYMRQQRVWEEQRTEAFDFLKQQMEKLVLEEEYKSDVLFIQGDMKTYHGKIIRVIDKGKQIRTGETDPETGKEKLGFDGFSLVPPTK
jgi:biopolymer transport protein ExbD